MKILFVRERWADGDPGKGPSDGSYMIKTWQRINTADSWQVFYYDQKLLIQDEETAIFPNDRSREALEKLLIDGVFTFQPDIVMFSHLLSWKERNISKETWKTVGALRNTDEGRPPIKVVGVWHEGTASDVIRVADEHADCVDLNLFLDTKDQFLKHTKRPEKCLGLYDPRDPDTFKPQDEKKIGIIFNGTLVDRAIRTQGFACLMAPRMFGINAAGVPVTKIGGRRELFVPEEQMVEMLGQSKICLNFSDAGDGGTRHYKGRVAEALLCGAMLLEWSNDETNSILTPFKDFVPFDGPEDLLQKANYYLTHDAERQKIAESGRAAAMEKLDGREFWRQLFERLEIK